MNKIHVLHHNDSDGYAAAYLVYKFLDKNNNELDITFYIMSYKEEEADKVIEEVETDDIVYIVDYSLQPEKMIELLKKTKRVVWLDHHRTAIRKYDDWADLIEEATGVDEIPGIRIEGMCGAALTYLYLFCQWNNTTVAELRDTCNGEEKVLETLHYYFIEKAPRWLILINDWDVWRHEYKDTKPLQTAIANELSLDLFYKLDNNFAGILQEKIETGKSYLEFRDQWSASFRKRYGFSKQIDFGDGRAYSVYLMNLGNANSDFFGPELDNHEICMNFCYNGNNVTFSMYSNKSDVDCGAIAATLGGGGHPGAAGFSADIVKAQEIIL